MFRVQCNGEEYYIYSGSLHFLFTDLHLVVALSVNGLWPMYVWLSIS